MKICNTNTIHTNIGFIQNITNKTLGILGGGQLGKMIATEAAKLGIKTCIFDPNTKSPAFQNANIIIKGKHVRCYYYMWIIIHICGCVTVTKPIYVWMNVNIY